jgi:putative oxidoreductase
MTAFEGAMSMPRAAVPRLVLAGRNYHGFYTLFSFAGRLLIALTFVMSGLSKVADYSGTLGLISATKLPLPAPLAYAGAVAVEIVCSVMLIVGFRTRAAAAVLALYCVATAVFFHANFSDLNNIIHFLKNVAMTGGLLQIVGFGAGVLSIDNRR